MQKETATSRIRREAARVLIEARNKERTHGVGMSRGARFGLSAGGQKQARVVSKPKMEKQVLVTACGGATVSVYVIPGSTSADTGLAHGSMVKKTMNASFS